MPLDPVLGAPGENGIRSQFRAVFGNNHPRLAAPLDQGCQCPGNPLARHRGVGDRRQALPCHIFDDVQDLKAPAPGKLVRVALANKMARIVWALLARGEVYRAPAAVA
jgi:hypothetical protein